MESSDTSIESIIKDIKSDVLGRVMQAILSGIDKKITDECLVDAVKEQ